MSDCEMIVLAKYSYKYRRDDWEQTRTLAHLIAQVNSTKKLKPTDLIKFPWDEEQKQHETQHISKEQIAKLFERADQLA